MAFLVVPDDHPVMIFTFLSLGDRAGDDTHFIVLTNSGQTVMQSLKDRQVTVNRMVKQELIAASIGQGPSLRSRLAAITVDGHLRVIDLCPDPHNHSYRDLGSIGEQELLGDKVQIQITAYEDQAIYAVRTPGQLLFADDERILCTCAVEGSGPAILGAITACKTCAGPAVRGAGALDTKHPSTLVLRSFGFQASHGDQAMCLNPSSEHCASLAKALTSEHVVDHAGFFTKLSSTYILGLRQPPRPSIAEKGVSSLRHRRRRDAVRGEADKSGDEDIWEAYSLSVDGDFTAILLPSAEHTIEDSESPDLYVTNAGPGAVVDEHSAAIAFGNVIKILKVAKTNGQTSNGVERNASLTRKRGGLRKTQ